MQPTPGWGGYDDDDELEPPGTVEAEFGIGSGLANPYPIPIPKPNPNPNQVEAECPQRALFRDESRQQGAPYIYRAASRARHIYRAASRARTG